MHRKLYHMGIRGRISKSTLSDANENRDWHIYADFAQVLIHTARTLISRTFRRRISANRLRLDATTIDLCLALFPWAHFEEQGSCQASHPLGSARQYPVFHRNHLGKSPRRQYSRRSDPEPGSFYIVDRGYLDFVRLYLFHQSQAFFVIRAKANLKYRRLYSRPVEKATGLRCDQTIKLTVYRSAQDYPETLRLVRFFDSENNNG